jgi:hypothetical protein
LQRRATTSSALAALIHGDQQLEAFSHRALFRRAASFGFFTA